MKSSQSCPKCNGKDIKRVSGQNQSKIGIPTGVISWVPITRYVCVNCGFVEEYIEAGEDIEKIKKHY